MVTVPSSDEEFELIPEELEEDFSDAESDASWHNLIPEHCRPSWSIMKKRVIGAVPKRFCRPPSRKPFYKREPVKVFEKKAVKVSEKKPVKVSEKKPVKVSEKKAVKVMEHPVKVFEKTSDKVMEKKFKAMVAPIRIYKPVMLFALMPSPKRRVVKPTQKPLALFDIL